jgi:sarcosine oxidase
MNDLRVAVVGAGSVGAATALALAREGVSVTMFDRYEPPHRLGAHAGESRLVRSLPYLEKSAGEARMLVAALEEWDRIERDSGVPLITNCGGLAIGHQESAPLTMMREAGRGAAEFLDPGELAARFPQFAVQPDEVAVFDRRGGIIDPAAAVAAMIDLARRAGAETRFNTGVVGLEPVAEGVVVRTHDETQHFGKVVVAAGAFSPGVEPGLPVRARRVLLGWFQPRTGSETLLRACPSFVWSPGPGGFLYGGGSYDRRTLKVGMDHDWGYVSDAAAEGRDVRVEDATPLRAAVARYLPWLEPEGDRFEMHLDGWAADESGLLGERPDRPGIVLATGWSGYGFKIAPAIGMAAADLALQRQPRFDISALDPTRHVTQGVAGVR